MTKNIKKEIVNMIKEEVEDALLLTEKKSVKITVNGKELEWGSLSHLADLKRTLNGLERIRDCYERGSGNRLVFGSACNKLRKLIEKLDTSRSNVT